MSFFNLRRGGSAAKSSAPTAPAESVETVRKHARQRLIGAAVLVLLGVIGFPLIFDTQPRPVAVDIPIEIPSRTASKPLAQPPAGSVASVAPAVDPAVVAAAPSTPAVVAVPVVPAAPVLAPAAPASSVVPPATSLQAKEEIVPPATKPAAAEAKPAAKVEPKPAPKVEAKPEVKAEVKAEPKVDAKAAEAQRAKALLEGKVPVATAATNEERLVVQVGAFADANKAREARLKLEKAGLKTYTQVAETKDGKRIRVRVGPYASKAEADKAAAKIKTLDLPASVLAL